MEVDEEVPGGVVLAALGSRLRTERLRLGLTQEAFSALAGLKKNSQINYEKGSTAPTVEYLLRWAEHGVDIAYVLTGQRLQGGLGAEETLLLQSFGRLGARERQAIVQLAGTLAGDIVGIDELARGRSIGQSVHARRLDFKGETDG